MLTCYNLDGLEQRFQCSIESSAVKRGLGGWCAMATSLGAGQLKVKSVKMKVGGWCEMAASLGVS
jgi:hypothetical protein